MPFRFQRHEPIADGVQRIADEQLQKAMDLLRSSDASSDEVVHDVRTCCKKLRGLARLMRFGLGSRYQTLNHTFRNEAHTLSVRRDADVLRDLWCDVAVELDGDLPLELGAVFHATVAARAAGTNQQPSQDLRQTLCEMAARMDKYRQSDMWRPLCDDQQCLFRGLKKSYRSACKALDEVKHTAGNASLHELRKRTKDHWYQMRLLRDVWKPVMPPRIDVCSDVSDELGMDHDLALFEELLHEMEAAPEHAAHVDNLQRHVRKRRQSLQQLAVRRCEYLYAEKPNRFSERMTAYWRIWRERH